MELSEYIKMALLAVPVKTRVSFDIGVRAKVDKKTKATTLIVDHGYDVRNKIRFSITKTE